MTSYPPVLIDRDSGGRAEEYNEAGWFTYTISIILVHKASIWDFLIMNGVWYKKGNDMWYSCKSSSW